MHDLRDGSGRMLHCMSLSCFKTSNVGWRFPMMERSQCPELTSVNSRGTANDLER